MKKYNLSNDIELIIECCKEDKNTKIIEEKISKIENWNSFIKLSTSHGVFPLIYHTLKEYQEKIPKEIFIEIKYLNLDIVKQNMLMTSELLKLINLYKVENIKVLSFKGPTLAQMAYGDITLRQYVDLDILINKNDFQKILDINYENGYILTHQNFLKNRTNFKYLKDISFFNSLTGVSIEVHFKTFNLPLLNNYNIFNLPHNIFLNNYEIKTFDLNYLIVYLSIHGFY